MLKLESMDSPGDDKMAVINCSAVDLWCTTRDEKSKLVEIARSIIVLRRMTVGPDVVLWCKEKEKKEKRN